MYNSDTLFSNQKTCAVSFPNKGTVFRLVAILLLLLPYTLTAQLLWYDITMAGKTIGSVCVLPDQKDGSIFTRTIQSTFNVPLLYSGNFESSTKRVNGVLAEAETLHSSNGKPKERTLTRPSDASGYQVAFYKSDTPTPSRRSEVQRIHHTVTDLYYMEPKNIEKVYSERYGTLCTLTPLSGNRYCLKLPSGKTSVYTYKEGVCQLVELELAGIKLKIVKRDDKIALNESLPAAFSTSAD